MTRRLLIFFLLLTSLTSLHGQIRLTSCSCPQTQYSDTKADTTFSLSNDRTIALCGYKNPDTRPTTFSEFVLYVCGQDSIVDFWGATLTCRLKVNKDTLLVEQIENLPTGMNQKFQQTVWTTEKIFFKKGKTSRLLKVNTGIQKYTDKEIKLILTEFENTKNGYDEKKMELVYKLFIASISGSKTARQYFQDFGNKFWTLDGADREEYNDLIAMLGLWDKK